MVRRLDPEQTLEALRPILENPFVEKVGQNLKYDMIVLRTAGVEVKGACFDTMVASYLLDAGERVTTLTSWPSHLRYKTTKIETLIGSGKTQRRMDEVPVSQVTHYAAEDADVALRLVPLLEARLKEASLDPLFNELEVPLIDVLVELEYNGMRIDPVRLGQLSREYGGALLKLEGEIYELAGRQFNIGSPKQLQEILFVEQKLPVLKRTKTGPSTDVDVLDELARLHPLPAKIIEYRQYAKLKSTYVDALPTMIHPQTGRIHASFNQTVAATGRLSSSDPNLQNIPIRTQESREIRSAFLPGEEDWTPSSLRLLADRAPRAGALFGRRGPARILCQKRGRPRPCRQPGVWRATRSGDEPAAASCQGRQLWRHLWAKPVRPFEDH